jgi:hypothetical protein
MATGNAVRNTTAIYPYVGNLKWNLITAMADDAIHWMTELNDIDPSMPFFLYYVWRHARTTPPQIHVVGVPRREDQVLSVGGPHRLRGQRPK